MKQIKSLFEVITDLISSEPLTVPKNKTTELVTDAYGKLKQVEVVWIDDYKIIGKTMPSSEVATVYAEAAKKGCSEHGHHCSDCYAHSVCSLSARYVRAYGRERYICDDFTCRECVFSGNFKKNLPELPHMTIADFNAEIRGTV
jgi:hypothetical protein